MDYMFTIKMLTKTGVVESHHETTLDVRAYLLANKLNGVFQVLPFGCSTRFSDAWIKKVIK